MDVQALLAPDAAAPLGQSRARVLDVLRAAGSPVGVQEVAEQLGVHPNTARFHLDALTDAGLAAREPLPRATPGRPSMAYRAADGGGPAGQRRYRFLAEMLTSLVTGMMPDPGEAAVQAGQEWGRYLTEQPPPYQGPGADRAVELLSATMAEVGFVPETVAGDGRYRLRLHQCPFREVAEGHQEVVCGLHLGLMQGALAQMRAPVTADRLEPFAEPSVCIAHLSQMDGQPPANGQPSRPGEAAEAAARPVTAAGMPAVEAAGSSGAGPAELDMEEPDMDEPAGSEPDMDEPDMDEPAGGEPACWAHLLCPECGAVRSEGHRPGCARATEAF